MEIADIVFELTPVKNASGVYQDAFRARFSLIRNRHEYRLWFYPAGTKRSWDAYSFWRGRGPTDEESRSFPIFRMECELVAQAILHEVTTNVSLEDVRVWRPDPAPHPGQKQLPSKFRRIGSQHHNRTRKNNRHGARGIVGRLSRLAHHPVYLYLKRLWQRAASIASAAYFKRVEH